MMGKQQSSSEAAPSDLPRPARPDPLRRKGSEDRSKPWVASNQFCKSAFPGTEFSPAGLGSSNLCTGGSGDTPTSGVVLHCDRQVGNEARRDGQAARWHLPSACNVQTYHGDTPRFWERRRYFQPLSTYFRLDSTFLVGMFVPAHARVWGDRR